MTDPKNVIYGSSKPSQRRRSGRDQRQQVGRETPLPHLAADYSKRAGVARRAGSM
jgi:hypothetical protein